MTFSVDKAYLEFFKSAAEGNYESGFLDDRLMVSVMGAGTAAAGAFRVLGRVIHLVIEVAKVAFYTLAALFTFGAFGNGKRLLDHCKLLVLDLAALIAQPLQVAVHLLATFTGLISPMVGYRLMQGGTAPLALITGAEKKIRQKYQTPEIYEMIANHLKSKIVQLFKEDSRLRGMATNVLFEFSESITSICVAPLGYMKRFHLYGANPQVLAEKQKKLIPILFLNGNRSHQGSFLALMHALHEKGNERPIYSFTLYNTDDINVVHSKILSIYQQYGQDCHSFKIDLVGHSMGAYFIDCLVNENPDYSYVRRAISIGTPISRNPKNCEAFDVIGTRDRRCTEKSILDPEHQVEIDTGHSGLIHDPKAQNAIFHFLMENN